MAKDYKEGDFLYLPVMVKEKETNHMTTDAKFVYTYWHEQTKTGTVRCGEDGLLLTAEEVAEKVADKIGLIARSTLEEYKNKATVRIQLLEKENEMHRRTSCNRDKEIAGLEELKTRNAELEALLKEVMTARDEAIRQNNALVEENDKLGTERDQRNKDIRAMKKERDELDSIGGKLRAENENLKAELDQRNKDFWAMKKDRDTLLAENEKLKAQNADGHCKGRLVKININFDIS